MSQQEADEDEGREGEHEERQPRVERKDVHEEEQQGQESLDEVGQVVPERVLQRLPAPLQQVRLIAGATILAEGSRNRRAGELLAQTVTYEQALRVDGLREWSDGRGGVSVAVAAHSP